MVEKLSNSNLENCLKYLGDFPYTNLLDAYNEKTSRVKSVYSYHGRCFLFLCPVYRSQFSLLVRFFYLYLGLQLFLSQFL
jgi:hypothetical protein